MKNMEEILEEEKMLQRISTASNMDHMIDKLIISEKDKCSKNNDPYKLKEMSNIDICRLRICLGTIIKSGSLSTLRPEGSVKELLKKTDLYVF